MTFESNVKVRGQDSFLLSSREVELALTRTGGMLGPVTFFPRQHEPVRPYAIAPWAEESLPADVPPMLRALRGDWFCSAFGENVEPYRGERLPPHGETANREWHKIDSGETSEGCWLRLGVDMPLQGGACQATTALLANQSIVYQRHDLSGLTGPVNPGHHATLSFPSGEGAARLSFSSLVHARTYVEPTARPEERGYSWLKTDAEIVDLHAAPCIDGSATDLCRYPARRGFEDLALLCADPAQEFAWSAVTYPEQRFVWFALRDPKQLAATLLWFSNGGRHFPPWNGRHVNVLGIEDITAYFHAGLAASSRENPLSARGIATCLRPDAQGRLSISYIQGVARIPADFDCVADIEGHWRDNSIVLRAASGAAVAVACHLDFLRMGTLPGLITQ